MMLMDEMEEHMINVPTPHPKKTIELIVITVETVTHKPNICKLLLELKNNVFDG